MGKIFMRGLITLAPMALTVAIVIWLFDMLEATVGWYVSEAVGPEYYFKGLGIILALIVIFIFGTLLNTWIVQKCIDMGDGLFHRIPLVKTLYQAITDFMSFFNKKGSQDMQRVCTVEMFGGRFLGLITRDYFDDLPEGVGINSEEVAVFLPMSYQIGGYTYIVKREKITPIDMSVEKAMRFLIMAGATAQPPGKKEPIKKQS